MPNVDPVLKLEEFKHHQNNFSLHFFENFIGKLYRTTKAYVACMEAHPKEFGELSMKLRAIEDLRSLEAQSKLHEAYKMMHEFADGNYDLCK